VIPIIFIIKKRSITLQDNHLHQIQTLLPRLHSIQSNISVFTCLRVFINQRYP